jgi:hypothetical protein
VDELDEAMLPKSAQVVLGVITVVGIIGFLLLALNTTPRNSPKPHGPLLGCYSTPGGPDMLFEATKVTVLQIGYRLEVKQSLEYHKGWAFSLERGLGWLITVKKRLLVDYSAKSGEFLFLSREGEVASRIPSFQLNAIGQLLAIRYVRSGDFCGSGGA